MTKLEIIKDNKLKFVEGILHEDELFTLELFLMLIEHLIQTSSIIREDIKWLSDDYK